MYVNVQLKEVNPNSFLVVTLYWTAMHGRCYWNTEMVFSDLFIFLKRISIKWYLMMVCIIYWLIDKIERFLYIFTGCICYFCHMPAHFYFSIGLFVLLLLMSRDSLYITNCNLVVVCIINIFSNFVTCHFILYVGFWWTKILNF